MSRSKHLLVGNWKMNYGPKRAASYARELREAITKIERTDVWVAPPDLSLPGVAQELSSSLIRYGTQNVHWAESGAFTGETAPSFLTDIGASFAIIGHSERRTLFGESSGTVAKRSVAALAAHITPIVCIGETEAERVADQTEHVLLSQLEPLFEALPKERAAEVILAYEPVWAIGTGKTATLEEIAATHQFIHKEWEQALGTTASILYGGSVNPANFAGILALPEVDGALVGGASLKLDQWAELVAIAERTALD